MVQVTIRIRLPLPEDTDIMSAQAQSRLLDEIHKALRGQFEGQFTVTLVGLCNDEDRCSSCNDPFMSSGVGQRSKSDPSLCEFCYCNPDD